MERRKGQSKRLVIDTRMAGLKFLVCNNGLPDCLKGKPQIA